MAINIIPPDPRAIEKARKEKLFIFSMLGILASAAMFLYLLGMGIGCFNSSAASFYGGCLSSFHPIWAGIVGSLTLFVIALSSAIYYAND